MNNFTSSYAIKISLLWKQWFLVNSESIFILHFKTLLISHNILTLGSNIQ